MITDVQFVYDINQVLGNHGLEKGGKVQRYIDSEVLRLSEQFIPKDTGTLIGSGIISTQIGSGEVIYQTPYARRWYYMPANFSEAPQRGNYWFEKFKQQYKNQVLEGAIKIAKQ